MPFCQLVIGPPGSGKSTYCHGMYQFMSAIGRHCSVVNLDAGNNKLPYPCKVDVAQWLNLDTIMKKTDLGPNGAAIFAMDWLLENSDQLIQELGDNDREYVLFDCPGQVELFTHNFALYKIIRKLMKLQYKIVVVHLVDSLHCTEPFKFVGALLLSLQSMLMLELPQVNVFSKIDLLNKQANLPFKLDFYTNVTNLENLKPLLDADARFKRFAGLNSALIDLIQDFSLVSFETLAIEDKASLTHLLRILDRANGYIFGNAEGGGDDLFVTAVRNGGEAKPDDQTRWVDFREHYDQISALNDEKLMNEYS